MCVGGGGGGWWEGRGELNKKLGNIFLKNQTNDKVKNGKSIPREIFSVLFLYIHKSFVFNLSSAANLIGHHCEANNVTGKILVFETFNIY